MTRDHITDLMEKILKKMYFNQWQLIGDQYSDIYNVSGSEKRQETYVEMAGVGLFQPGDAIEAALGTSADSYMRVLGNLRLRF